MTIDDLKKDNLILLEVLSGSKSFGLDTPTSDTDIKGVFYLPKEKFFGMEYIPQVSNESNDIVYYELGRFIELLTKNNPNILEILASPQDCILYKNPIMDQLRLEDFLSKLCKDTFAGYATTQIKKARGLKKKIVNPLPKEKKTVIDFCFILDGHNAITFDNWLQQHNLQQEKCGLSNISNSKGMYALFYDHSGILNYKGVLQKESSNTVVTSSIPKNEKQLAYLSFNLEAYSSYCKEYREYWDWVEKRNDERFSTNMQHGKNYDSKNMMHTIRLLQSAEQILEKNNLSIKVDNREELLKIKKGEFDYNEILDKADCILKNIETLYSNSILPDSPDKKKAEGILISMRSMLYK
ncbi:nucleotidyltransferase domain-containing protein [Flavobacterium rakeshii]|uniref:nucleotidyltransferase domain-containing protein n=1 Tax=Flavobacterium rakeshii TaxID=1038845 RepID=UPI002E7BC088|nr:nucleotidyltransferase domain-containing protein [Flavobacterium rakeshii]MEE1896761.1 nucleotidyltransferase domain-containing protein [Flavobacterium rakeshii]